LTANYTFLNERLARHYGVPHAAGINSAVTLTDETRFGLLGQGSILTVTSATRTSPVLRGKWILDNILGMPPPISPPDLPALDDTGEAGRPASVRERSSGTAGIPACGVPCANGSARLSLENFDGVASGERPSGRPDRCVRRVPGWPHASRSAASRALPTAQTQRDQFVATLTESDLRARARSQSSTSRRCEKSRDAASSDARWSALIRES
jgi:hypothetical protein